MLRSLSTRVRTCADDAAALRTVTVAEKGDYKHLPQVLIDFDKLVLAKLGIVEAVVTSAGVRARERVHSCMRSTHALFPRRTCPLRPSRTCTRCCRTTTQMRARRSASSPRSVVLSAVLRTVLRSAPKPLVLTSFLSRRRMAALVAA